MKTVERVKMTIHLRFFGVAMPPERKRYAGDIQNVGLDEVVCCLMDKKEGPQ